VDIAKLKGAQRDLVFATNTPELENPTLVEKLALFNINEEHEAGNGDEPEGPFRASMTIAGLAFTSLNNFVCRPPTCTPGVNNATIDDSTRDREIGWGGMARSPTPRFSRTFPPVKTAKMLSTNSTRIPQLSARRSARSPSLPSRRTFP